MNLQVFLLIFNLILSVARSQRFDNRDVSPRYHVDNDNVKMSVDTSQVNNNVNKISKLRLILISDLKKQNEIISPIEINCLSQPININTKNCPCNSITCKNYASNVATSTDIKRRSLYTSCYNICCRANRAKRPQIRSLDESHNNKKFLLSTICNQNNHRQFNNMTKTNNIARIYEHSTKNNICMGILIHPKFVLTTGICILKKQPNEIAVRFNNDNSFNVAKILIHDKFLTSIDTLDNNIAILQLEQNADYIKPLACITKSRINAKSCYLYSWNSKQEDQLTTIDNLEIIGKQSCFETHKSKNQSYEKYVNDGNVCVISPETDNGLNVEMSGAPLYCHLENILNDKIVELPILKGLLTWNTKINYQPHLFTDITEYVEWIEETINKNI